MDSSIYCHKKFDKRRRSSSSSTNSDTEDAANSSPNSKRYKCCTSNGDVGAAKFNADAGKYVLLDVTSTKQNVQMTNDHCSMDANKNFIAAIKCNIEAAKVQNRKATIAAHFRNKDMRQRRDALNQMFYLLRRTQRRAVKFS